MKKTAKKNPKHVPPETTSSPAASEGITAASKSDLSPSERARQRSIASRQAALNRVLAH